VWKSAFAAQKQNNKEILWNVKLLQGNWVVQFLKIVKNVSVRTKNNGVKKKKNKLGWLAQSFIDAKNLKGISDSVNCPVDLLNEQVSKPIYNSFTIPKKTGGVREIQAPGINLKYIQRRLSVIFNQLYQAPDGVHGFVAKTENECYSILSNAQKHVNKKWVWNLDIKNFFWSISTQKVANRFMLAPFNFEESKAKYISLMIGYERKLPMGSPCSPVVSNLVCEELDQQINDWVLYQNELLPGANLVYTRYADDITFSANLLIEDEQKEIIYYMLNQHGFEVNEKKDRTQSHKQAQWVTGVKVNEKPNLDRKYIRNIRAALHQAREKGLAQAAQNYFNLPDPPSPETIDQFLSVLRGKISHLGFVKGKDDQAFLKYWKEWRELKEEYILDLLSIALNNPS